MKWPVYGVRLTIHAVNVIRLSLLTVIQRRATWLLFAVATTVYCFQFFFLRQHDNLRTAALSLMKFCTNVYLDNL